MNLGPLLKVPEPAARAEVLKPLTDAGIGVTAGMIGFEGENYASILTGIPKGAAVVIRARSFNEPLHSLVVNDKRLEISVPTPGIYTVEVAKFPYVDWFAILEVTQ